MAATVAHFQGLRPRLRVVCVVWAAAGAIATLAGCGDDPAPIEPLSSFEVAITAVNGATPPPVDGPLPANLGDVLERWDFEIQARDPQGRLEPFDGVVRLSVRPGAVMGVEGEGAVGRNIRLTGGQATGQVVVTAIYGQARLWVEDIGYLPAAPGAVSRCENGENDDEDDVLVDFPNDPGCAFADDDSEEEGTFAAGISDPVHYALPRLSDIQGHASTTPYPFEGIEVGVAEPQHVVVTRVSSDGFYVTDIAPAEVAAGFNSLFAFNFNTPARMRVCDRVVYLAGTVNEFFGFTELSFPSYRLSFPIEGESECEVPEPRVLSGGIIPDPIGMEKLESALVRVRGLHVSTKFGPNPVKDNVPGPDASSCDLNGDGQVDFASEDEGSCSNVCADDEECTEWTAFSARGNYKVSGNICSHDGEPCEAQPDCERGPCVPPGPDQETGHCTEGNVPCAEDSDCAGSCSLVQIQINTGNVAPFDPRAHKGGVLTAVTGTMRNFSGGSLNWTIETRCPDDLVCDDPACITAEPISSKSACVRLRTDDDNEQGTN